MKGRASLSATILARADHSLNTPSVHAWTPRPPSKLGAAGPTDEGRLSDGALLGEGDSALFRPSETVPALERSSVDEFLG